MSHVLTRWPGHGMNQKHRTYLLGTFYLTNQQSPIRGFTKLLAEKKEKENVLHALSTRTPPHDAQNLCRPSTSLVTVA